MYICFMLDNQSIIYIAQLFWNSKFKCTCTQTHTAFNHKN